MLLPFRWTFQVKTDNSFARKLKRSDSEKKKTKTKTRHNPNSMSVQENQWKALNSMTLFPSTFCSSPWKPPKNLQKPELGRVTSMSTKDGDQDPVSPKDEVRRRPWSNMDPYGLWGNGFLRAMAIIGTWGYQGRNQTQSISNSRHVSLLDGIWWICPNMRHSRIFWGLKKAIAGSKLAPFSAMPTGKMVIHVDKHWKPLDFTVPPVASSSNKYSWAPKKTPGIPARPRRSPASRDLVFKRTTLGLESHIPSANWWKVISQLPWNSPCSRKEKNH